MGLPKEAGYYWKEVRKIEKELEGESVYVTSLETPNGGVAGRTRSLPRELAARSIASRSDRLATPEEIEDCLSHESEKREEIQKAEFDRKHPISITVKNEDARGVDVNKLREELRADILSEVLGEIRLNNEEVRKGFQAFQAEIKVFVTSAIQKSNKGKNSDEQV